MPFNLLRKLPLKVTADNPAALHGIWPQVIFKDGVLMKNTSLIFKEGIPDSLMLI